MNTPTVHCLVAAATLAIGLSAAPISHTGNGISFGYSQANADDAAKKSNTSDATKSCSKDKPCNDAKAKDAMTKKVSTVKVAKDKPAAKATAAGKDKPKEKVAAKAKAEPKEIAHANAKAQPKHSDD